MYEFVIGVATRPYLFAQPVPMIWRTGLRRAGLFAYLRIIAMGR